MSPERSVLLDRRQFLKLGSLATTLAAAAPGALAEVIGDGYRNRRMGLSFRKPGDWGFLSTLDFQAASRRQVVDLEPALRQILEDPGALPVVVATKYPAGYDALNPAITVYDEPIEPGFETDLDYHSGFLQAMSDMLQDVSIHREAHAVRLGRAPATRSHWHFLYRLDDGREWRVETITHLVFRGDRCHTIHLMGGHGGPAFARQEIAELESSLRYENEV